MESAITKFSFLNLEFTPEWRLLRQLRTFVDGLTAIGTQNFELATRVAMTITELGENAVKYSEGENPAVIRLRLDPAVRLLRVESENDASPHHISELQAFLQKINQYEPDEAYRRALLAAAQGDAGASRVGLARIRCEGQMSLRCETHGSRVKMVAECSIPSGIPIPPGAPRLAIEPLR